MAIFFRSLAAWIVLGCFVAPAWGHPALENPRAEAGSSYRAAIRLTHGCAGSPIREVVVEIPPGVRGARPMPKPGWTIAIERERLAQPYTMHGHAIDEDVARIRWTGGPLDLAYFDEFVLLADLPETPGALYWKVSQICEQGRIDWTDVPPAGKTRAGLKAPAAVLEVMPKQGQGQGHQH